MGESRIDGHAGGANLLRRDSGSDEPGRRLTGRDDEEIHPRLCPGTVDIRATRGRQEKIHLSIPFYQSGKLTHPNFGGNNNVGIMRKKEPAERPRGAAIEPVRTGGRRFVLDPLDPAP